MRLTLIDGFRGYFLLFMMIAHVAPVVNAPIGVLTHHSIGWVEDAQGFVFVSGLVVGLVYGKLLLKRGYETMTSSIWSRIRKIYAYQAALIGVFLVAALVFAAFAEVPSILSSYAREPVLFTLVSLLLVGGSMHMGILPMYVFFMIATPFVLWAFKTGRGPVVLITSVLLWLGAQLGLTDILQPPIEGALREMGHPVNIGIYFDVLGWQVLFFAGLYPGYLMANKTLSLEFLKKPAYEQAFFVGLVGFTALAVFDIAVRQHWFGADYSNTLYWTSDRAMLAPIYVVAFFLDLFLIVWLISAGQESSRRWINKASVFANWFFTRPFLTTLGRHSLQVFTIHILAVYVIEIWAEGRDVSAMTANIIVLLSPLPLYITAWMHEEIKRKRAAAAVA
ncbi:hypothetical protein CDV50_01505 [Haematobacter massiliensis]|uniref:Uncharacterized protein n=1 Tax=Haematobacter massiliensis TaxID=195105 RepID=A0A086XYS4_9RHOB|nr:OpgC domain-containing protein [Haematobacter massiliensis]KFI27174.1 hypothetical protein CN97_01615 [Haematobacter massiliensis]OWJ73774.1 hypothetical protein CDV50_01505 [Haematobacter massiliensis]OWJ82466.1 hypothetical protein CDV51_17745 [Haematobacter massiliensis]QBJ23617.1 hypothetical protein HmaOT1_04700 [Haematobacter massiliensis]